MIATALCNAEVFYEVGPFQNTYFLHPNIFPGDFSVAKHYVRPGLKGFGE